MLSIARPTGTGPGANPSPLRISLCVAKRVVSVAP